MSLEISISDIGLAKTSISSFTTNCEIEQIDASCFKKSKSIAEISISSVNQPLPDEIFANCTNLTSLQLPALREITGKIFGKTRRSYPKKLKTVKFNDCTEDIGCILSGFDQLEDVRLPKALKTLSSNALFGNKLIKALDVPRNAYVEDGAFESLESLEDLSCKICEANTNLGLSSLHNLENVTILNPENSLYSITPHVLADLQLTNLVFEDSAVNMQSIRSGALSGLGNIKELDFSNSLVDALPTSAFAQDEKLSCVKMNDNFFRTLQKNAFAGISAIRLLGNKNLKEIDYPGAKVHYEENFAKGVFQLGPSAFYQASFAGPVEMLIETAGDSAFEQSGVEAVFLQFGKSSQRELGARAFAECNQLKTAFVTSISCIGKSCFQSCRSLERFSTNTDFSALEHSFEDCTSLSSFPVQSLTAAGDCAFSGCVKLFDACDEVDLRNVKYFGKDSFRNAISCAQLHLDGTLIQKGNIFQNAFADCNAANVRLHGIKLDDMLSCSYLSGGNLTEMHTALKNWLGLPDSTQFELDDVVIRRDGKGNAFACLVVENGVLKTIDSSAADYKRFLEDAVIPYNVTEIGENAFSHFTQLRAIDLNNVSLVSKNAFACCQNLKTVVASKLQTVQEHAFADCESLEEFDFSSVQTIGRNAFQNCKRLVYAEGNRLVDISEGAFLNCQALREVQSSSVLRIGQIAFGNCFSLEKVNFEDSGLEAIDKYTFIGCNSLISLRLGNKINLIDEFALRDTNSRLTVTFSEMYPLDAIAVVKADNICDSPVGTKFGICSKGEDRMLLHTISDDEIVRFIDNARAVALFKDIGSAADIFDIRSRVLVGIKDENITASTSAEITGNTITAIAPYALATTRKLTKLTVSPTVELSIASHAFSYNTSLKEVILNNKVSQIDNDAFSRCAVEKVTLPPLTAVGGYGLNESYALSSLTIANGTKQIMPSAMIDCGPIMTNVTFPTTIEKIGDYAFAEMHSYFPNLSAAQIRELTNLTEIGNYAFYNSMKTVDDDVLRIPSKVKKIGAAAFGYNEDAWTFTISALEAPEIALASNVQEIGPSAFIFNGLRNIIFNTEEPSLTSIGDYAFAYPKKKYSIRIPKTIKRIGEGAFKKNVILNPDFVQKNIISIDLDSDAQILNVINSISSLDFTAQNTISVTDHTCILATGTNAKENQNFLYALDGKLNLCPDTMRIDIQNRELLSVVSKGIVSSLIPKYIDIIGENAYADCTQLTTVSALNPDIQMQASAFCNCNALEQINGPDQFFISKADPYLFWNCQKLENVRLLSAAEYVGECAFYNCSSLTTLQDKTNYDQLDYWTLTAIGPSAFLSCSSLHEFIIPHNIVSIGNSAFDCCTSLDRLQIDRTTQQFKKIMHRESSDIGEVVADMFSGIRPDANCQIVFNDIVYMNDGDVKLDIDMVGIRQIDGNLSAISAVDVFELEDRQQDYLNLSAVAQVDSFTFRGVEMLRMFNVLPSDSVRLSVIGDYAFSKCTNLQHINGDLLSCVVIGQHAFDSCKSLDTLQLDLNLLQRIESCAFARSGLKKIIFCTGDSKTERDEDTFLAQVKQKVGYDVHERLNPMMLPEECQIAVTNEDGQQIGLYDCQFNSLMHSDIDINRNQMVFIDKDYGSIKPLLLVKPVADHLPAIVKNEYHVNIIGRWK